MKVLTALFFGIDLILATFILLAFFFRDVELSEGEEKREGALIVAFIIAYIIIVFVGGGLIFDQIQMDGVDISLEFFMSLINLIALLIIGYVISLIYGKDVDGVVPMKKTMGIVVQIIGLISALIGIIVFIIEY